MILHICMGWETASVRVSAGSRWDPQVRINQGWLNKRILYEGVLRMRNPQEIVQSPRSSHNTAVPTSRLKGQGEEVGVDPGPWKETGRTGWLERACGL